MTSPVWGQSFFGSRTAVHYHNIEMPDQISVKFGWLFNIIRAYVGLKRVWSFSFIRQVAPRCWIALPVSITRLQWPWLPGPQFSHPLTVVWDVIRAERLCDRTFACAICRSAHVSSGDTGDWIQMPFGVVSAVGLGMGVFGGGDHRRGLCCIAVWKCIQWSSCRLAWWVGWAQAFMC